MTCPEHRIFQSIKIAERCILPHPVFFENFYLLLAVYG